MRAILAAATLLLSLSSAVPEPEHWPSVPASLDIDTGKTLVSLVEVEPAPGDLEKHPAAATLYSGQHHSPVPATLDLGAQNSAARPDLSTQSSPPPTATLVPDKPTSPPAATLDPSKPVSPPAATLDSGKPISPPALSQGPAKPSATPVTSQPSAGIEAAGAQPVPLGQVCNALFTSAQDNGLPVAFFANLIWQESRLRDDAVSPKGAVGIAQFMPKVAAESGLQNPFDPLQALPASARMLRGLRDQFGNLGLVAAAYNAGAKRVSEWLQRRRTLPRETRGYVLDVTGRSVEQWRKAPPSDEALQFARHLPCRELPAFAGLEQAQSEEAQTARKQPPRVQAEQPQPERKSPAKVAEKGAPAKHRERERVAEDRRLHVARPHVAARREAVHMAMRERNTAKREARERLRRPPRERRRRV